jgi:SAM-dependent methyltransferase
MTGRFDSFPAADIMSPEMRSHLSKGLKLRYHAVCRTLSGLIDRALNVDTAEMVDITSFGFDGTNRSGYEAASWLDVRRVLAPADVSEDDVFLDLGSGKGRIVLLAARYPFKRVIGVELVDRLSAIARRNVATCRVRPRCRDIELVTADVVGYRIPDDVTVVFLFNPFQGPILDAAVASLIASVDRRPRTVRVIYRADARHDRLTPTGRFRLVRVSLGLRPGREWRETTAVRLYALEPMRSEAARTEDRISAHHSYTSGHDCGSMRAPAAKA